MTKAKTTANRSSTGIIVFIAVVVIAIGAAAFLRMPDNRSTPQRLADATDTLSNGGSLHDAGRQLEKRTPGEKLGDAVKDTGNDIKRAAQ